MATPINRPIFVVGSPRSGTTLLRFILSSHPNLAIPAETGFIPSLKVDPEKNLSKKEVLALLEQIASLNKEWADIANPATFYESLSQPRLAACLDALYRLKIGAKRIRWGDKTPAYVLHIPLIAALFPEAQFIHMIRDGRDVLLSAKRKWGGQAIYMDSVYILKNWVNYVKTGQQSGRSLGRDRYLEMHYESLVSEPEEALGQICSFLGEEQHPDMLRHQALAQKQIGDRGHIEVRQPISTASVSRWRQEMSAFDLKCSAKIAGSCLRQNGYELSELTAFTVGEWVEYGALNTKYAFVHAGRKVLTKLGLLSLNRRKRV